MMSRRLNGHAICSPCRRLKARRAGGRLRWKRRSIGLNHERHGLCLMLSCRRGPLCDHGPPADRTIKSHRRRGLRERPSLRSERAPAHPHIAFVLSPIAARRVAAGYDQIRLVHNHVFTRLFAGRPWPGLCGRSDDKTTIGMEGVRRLRVHRGFAGSVGRRAGLRHLRHGSARISQMTALPGDLRRRFW